MFNNGHDIYSHLSEESKPIIKFLIITATIAVTIILYYIWG